MKHHIITYNKILFATLLCLIIGNTVSARSKSIVRERVNINREWRFHLGDLPDAEKTGYDDHAWTATHLPHSFSIPYFAYTDVYHGYGWYRKMIRVGREWQGKRIGIDRLGKGAIAFYNGDGASIAEFQNPGVPNIVSEYGYPAVTA